MITSCRHLTELNISGTSISTEGRARVLMALPSLQSLVLCPAPCCAPPCCRCGATGCVTRWAGSTTWRRFVSCLLCCVVRYCGAGGGGLGDGYPGVPAQHGTGHCTVQTVHTVQDYFFHETWQLESLLQRCPNIQRMLFIQVR